MSGTEWLSEGAERFLANYSRAGHHAAPVLDVVIVGSGYGGSVAAARLAQHTHQGKAVEVFVFERGKEYVPGDFPNRLADLPGHVRLNNDKDPQAKGKRDGLFDVRTGKEVSALVGNGLGGGSLINAGVMAEPTAQVFQNGWPRQISDPAVLKQHFAKVRGMLGAAKLPLADGEHTSAYTKPPKLAALEQVGKLLDDSNRDRRAEIAVTFSAGTSAGGVVQQPCIQCGDCFTGCNYWAKNTLAMNYLPYAKARGVRLITGITVSHIEREGEIWILHASLTDKILADKYAHSEGIPELLGQRLRIMARRVVLSAGTFGSTEILLRSAGTLPMSPMLGERFSTNGDMIAAGFKMRPLAKASSKEDEPPAQRGVGPTITGMIDLRDDPDLSKQIAIEEMAAPAALRRMLEETVTNLDSLESLTRLNAAIHTADLVGQDPAGIDQIAIDHTTLYAIMGHDESKARIELVEGVPSARRSKMPSSFMPSDGGIRIRQGQSARPVGEQSVFQLGIDRLKAAHADPSIGGTVLPNPLWDPWPKELALLFTTSPNKGGAVTVHPLGGCAMADSRNEGVVNHLGQVFLGDAQTSPDAVYDTLAVLDGAIIPTSLGINPSLTIAAVAERAIEGLKGAWHFEAIGDAVPTPLAPPPQRAAQTVHDAPKPTGFRFAEKLDGEDLQIPVAIAGTHAPYERIEFMGGELRLDFVPVPDMADFLASLPKIMTVERGSLRLKPRDGQVLELPVAGYMSLLELEDSRPWQRVLRGTVAWFLNRGLQDLWHYASGQLVPAAPAQPNLMQSAQPSSSLLSRAKQLLRVASHVGERRQYRYDLEVTEDILWAGECYFRAGDRLIGEKIIAYQYRSNPWHQWMDMKLYVQRKGAARRTLLGDMRVDLPHYVRRHAIQLQLTSQDSQPQAVADLISFATYIARTMARIHLLSFRLPDYPPSLVESSVAGDARVHHAQFHRLPGTVDGVIPLRVEPLAKTYGEYVLHRYTPASARTDLGPVVLIHGFGASGSSFTLPTVAQNLVGHLMAQGFDTWVLDLRTSIALDTSHVERFFEDVAFDDIPPAIAQIRAACGGAAVNVIAHCIGSAMFCMAALAGKLPQGAVRAAVLSQMAPLVRVTPLNLFRGYVAGYVRNYLNMKELDLTHARSDWMDFIDRILATYPYPDVEWPYHHSLRPWARFEHEVFCNRASAIYNTLFEHRNMNHATLEAFGDLIGHVNLQTYLQTIHFARQQRITDQLGRNIFVTPEKVAAHLRFPIFFAHGEKNQLFKVDTSRDSFDMMASVFKAVTTARADGSWQHGPYRFQSIENYGHQDFIIGAEASRDVFPLLSAFLADVAPFVYEENAKRLTLRPARLGPILGWLRRQNGKRRAAIRLVPDDRTSMPTHAVTVVCAGAQTTTPVPGYCVRHPLVGLNFGSSSIPPPRMIEVDLPDDTSLTVLVMLLHAEYAPENFDDHAFLSLDTSAALTSADDNLEAFSEELLAVARLRELAFDVTADARTADARYEHQPCSVFLSEEVLQAADMAPGTATQPFTFAAGSCRFAANAFDRELADQSFGRLRRLLEDPFSSRRNPQMLVLMGDQIYADATAGLFDPKSPIDRYDNQYAEAWSAPNMRQLLRRLPAYMMLDDHEIRENYENDRQNTVINEALPTFRAYQLLGAPPNPVGRRDDLRRPYLLWYPFSNGGYEFFMLDTRTERRHRMLADDELDDAMLDDTQWNYLQNWLLTQDKVRPKFIVSPSVVAPWSKASRGSPANALRADAWDGLPYSLNRLLAFIVENDIQRVVFVSGDYHTSMVCEMQLSMAHHSVNALSIVTSGLYAPYPFVHTSAARLELAFDDLHQQWVDPKHEASRQLAPVRIRYYTRPQSIVQAQSIGLISVMPSSVGSSWRVEVEFDTADGLVRDSIVL